MILLDNKIKAYLKIATNPTNLKIGPPSHKLEEPIYFSLNNKNQITKS